MKFGGNSIVYGLLAATYPAFPLIGAPILGRWSDIYGRKKNSFVKQCRNSNWLDIISFCFNFPFCVGPLLLTILGTIIIIVPLLLIFLARAIDGITGGNISVANAYLSDISSDENRSKNFGKMAISSNLGFILGPVLPSWNFRWNNLWNNTTSSSSAITISGYVNCDSLYVKRIQALVNQILVPEGKL